MELSPFAAQVVRTVRAIPRGKVATYAQVAALSGKPHASRGVAWILNSCSRKYRLPWHRVLSSRGRISFAPGSAQHRRQRVALQREGVRFDGLDLDLSKYQWARRPKVERNKNRPKMFG